MSGNPLNDYAFPHIAEGNQGPIGYSGMTLRDYFAAAALQGYAASFAGLQQSPDIKLSVQWAYRVADYMLTERAK